MAKILIVEDDTNLVEVLRDHMQAEHHTVEVISDGQMALDLLRTYEYDVVILDLNLPSMGGVEICQKYRFHGGAARVLMLTGKKAIEEKEVGFEAGADDYLTKPFSVKELIARVRALMRRTREVVSDEITIGGLTMVPRNFHATKNGDVLRLTPKEFALLEFLMRHPNEVFKGDALLDRIWPSDTDASPDTVKSYIHRIREKLGTGKSLPTIATAHGAGYKLVPPS